MQCSQGHSNADNQIFCGTCGERLIRSEEATPEVASMYARADLTPVPTPPAKTTSRRLIVIGVLAAILLAAAGGVVFAMNGGEPQRELKGAYILFDEDGDIDGGLGDCQGTGGYSDFDEGTPVRVKNEKGDTIGSGTLRNAPITEIASRVAAAEGKSPKETAETLSEIDDGFACVLLFEAKVERAKHYSVEIGSGRRGELTYSHEELDEKDWVIESTLGL